MNGSFPGFIWKVAREVKKFEFALGSPTKCYDKFEKISLFDMVR